jgi:hypothetical protein
MARSFETQAVIKLVDQLSGPMSQLAKSMQGIQKTMAGDADRAAKEMEDATRSRFGKMRDIAKEAFAAMTVTAGAAAVHMVREIATVGFEIDRTMSKYQALGHHTPEETDGLRRVNDVNNVKVGPHASDAANATWAAQSSGVRDPEKQQALMDAARLYALDSGESLEQSMREVIDHFGMQKELKGPNGENLTVEQADPKQIHDKSMEMVGRLAMIAQVSGQTFDQVYQAFKTAGPAMNSVGMKVEDAAVLISGLSQSGIKGVEAGTAIKSTLAHAIVTTGPERFAMKEAGVNINDFIETHPEVLETKNLMKALHTSVGTLGKVTEARIAKVVANFKATGDTDQYLLDLTNTLVASGDKSMKDRKVAGNLAQKTIAGLVGKVDFLGLVEDIMKKAPPGHAVALLDAVFGGKMGGRLAAFDTQQAEGPGGFRDQYHAFGDPRLYANHALEEWDRSPAAAKDRLTHAETGMYDQLFVAGRDELTKAMNFATGVLQGLAGLSDASRKWIDAALISAAGLTAVGTALTLAKAGLNVWMPKKGKGEPKATELTPAEAVASPPEAVVAPEAPKPIETPPAPAEATPPPEAASTPIGEPPVAPPAPGRPSLAERMKDMPLDADADLDHPIGKAPVKAPAEVATVAAEAEKDAAIVASRLSRIIGPLAKVLAPVGKALNPLLLGYSAYEQGKADIADGKRLYDRIVKGGQADEFNLDDRSTWGAPRGTDIHASAKSIRDQMGWKQARDAALAAQQAGHDEADPSVVDAYGNVIEPTRTPAFINPPQGVTQPAEKPVPQEVRVTGDADIRQTLDIKLTGMDAMAGEVRRQLQTEMKVNLGSSLSGPQGVTRAPFTAIPR